MTGTPASSAFLTAGRSDLASTATRTMASTPLVSIESTCSCWMATSPLALAFSTVQSSHSSVILSWSKRRSCVSQRAVVESGSSTPIIGVFPVWELSSVSCPQASRATAVEIAVKAMAAPRMQAFM